jgi:hypothetical protein
MLNHAKTLFIPFAIAMAPPLFLVWARHFPKPISYRATSIAMIPAALTSTEGYSATPQVSQVSQV